MNEQEFRRLILSRAAALQARYSTFRDAAAREEASRLLAALDAASRRRISLREALRDERCDIAAIELELRFEVVPRTRASARIEYHR